MDIAALPAASRPQRQMAAPSVLMPEGQPIAVCGAIPQHQMAVAGVSITQVAFDGAKNLHQVTLAPQPDLSTPNLDWQRALPLSAKTALQPGQRKASVNAGISGMPVVLRCH